MPVTSIDTTNLTTFCHFCGTARVTALASLVAGTPASPNVIKLTACVTCASGGNGATGGLIRSWYNPMVEAGVVNGLHRALVTLAQTHATWTAYLNAETELVKPSFYYLPSATLRTVYWGTGGEPQHDLDAVVSLFSAAEAKRLLGLNAIFPDRDAAATELWVNSLYATPAEQEAVALKLETLRAKVGLP